MKKTLHAWLLWLFIGAGCVLAVLINRPPPAAEAQSGEQFSVNNAIGHIQTLARRSHAVGEEEHRRVRESLVAALRELGLKPEEQKDTKILYRGKNHIRAVRVRNIIAKLEGENDQPAVLLMAHYDSVPESPGANDDGAGVASILEILRVLKMGERPAGDVIALFSDGEEFGLVGARAFFDSHPLATSVGVVLNLDVRGSRGAAYMYEAGPKNLPDIQVFARSAGAPIGNSLSGALYQRMPNDTDFSIARRQGLPGLNIAYFDGWFTYHQPLDDLDHLNPAALHHLGSTALECCRAFVRSGAGGKTNRSGDAVYFNLWRTWLVVYPISLGWVGTGLALFLLAATAFVGLHNRRMSLPGILKGFGLTALSVSAATGLTALLIKALDNEIGTPVSRMAEMPVFRDRLLPALILILLAVFLWIFGMASRRSSIPSLAIGGMAWWMLAALAAQVLLPQGNFLFLWPLIFSLLGLWLVADSDQPKDLSTLRILLLGLTWLPALIIPVQVFYVATMAFSIKSWLFPLPALVCALLIPALAVWRQRTYLFAGICLTAGLIVLGTIWFAPGSERPPTREPILYYSNADSGEAVLGVRRPGEWARRFLPSPEPFDLPEILAWPHPLLAMRQPPLEMPPPLIRATEDIDGDEGRILTLGISSPRAAPCLQIQFPLKDVRSAELDGQPLRLLPKDQSRSLPESGASDVFINILGAEAEDLQLRLELRGNEPLSIRCADLSYDLPNGVRLPPVKDNLFPCKRTAIFRSFLF